MPGTGSVCNVLVYLTTLGLGPYIALNLVSKNKNIYIKFKLNYSNAKLNFINTLKIFGINKLIILLFE